MNRGRIENRNKDRPQILMSIAFQIEERVVTHHLSDQLPRTSRTVRTEALSIDEDGARECRVADDVTDAGDGENRSGSPLERCTKCDEDAASSQFGQL